MTDDVRNPPIDVTPPPLPPPAFNYPDRKPEMASSALQRFIGGAPTAVFLRLLFVSLVVGALLVWLSNTLASVVRGSGNMRVPSMTLLAASLAQMALSAVFDAA